MAAQIFTRSWGARDSWLLDGDGPSSISGGWHRICRLRCVLGHQRSLRNPIHSNEALTTKV
jgi:hypothetical protein